MKRLFCFLLFFAFLTGCQTDKISVTLTQQADETIATLSLKNGEEGGNAPEFIDLIYEGNVDTAHWLIWGVIPEFYRNDVHLGFDEGIFFVMEDGSYSELAPRYLNKYKSGVYYPTPDFLERGEPIMIPFKKMAKPEKIKGVIFLVFRGTNKSGNDYYVDAVTIFKAFYYPVTTKKINKSTWQLYLNQKDRKHTNIMNLFSNSDTKMKKDIYRILLNN